MSKTSTNPSPDCMKKWNSSSRLWRSTNLPWWNYAHAQSGFNALHPSSSRKTIWTTETCALSAEKKHCCGFQGTPTLASRLHYYSHWVNDDKPIKHVQTLRNLRGTMVHRTLQMGMEWVELPESTQVPQGKEHKKIKPVILAKAHMAAHWSGKHIHPHSWCRPTTRTSPWHMHSRRKIDLFVTALSSAWLLHVFVTEQGPMTQAPPHSMLKAHSAFPFYNLTWGSYSSITWYGCV